MNWSLLNFLPGNECTVTFEKAIVGYYSMLYKESSNYSDPAKVAAVMREKVANEFSQKLF